MRNILPEISVIDLAILLTSTVYVVAGVVIAWFLPRWIDGAR